MNIETLKQWFLKHKREFPWRKAPSPYEVLVSEVMLQQTQANVVIEYYLRWMEVFPDIKALSEAPLEKVVKLWEGLGYYSRARSLHEAAVQIMKEFGGQIPDVAQELIKIKGIGPYTVGAILSFAYHKKKAAIDGNVLRVIARYEGIREDIAKQKTRSQISEAVEMFLPEKEPWVVMEALIELGATICKKKPHCGRCPIRLSCKAYEAKEQELLPIKKSAHKIIKLYRHVCLIECGADVLVRLPQKKGALMGELWEFPYMELEKPLEEKIFPEVFSKIFSKSLFLKRNLAAISHSFTRYKAYLYPSSWQVFSKENIEGYAWIKKEMLNELPFSAGHRKLRENLMEIEG